jgi:hypothetical protein
MDKQSAGVGLIKALYSRLEWSSSRSVLETESMVFPEGEHLDAGFQYVRTVNNSSNRDKITTLGSSLPAQASWVRVSVVGPTEAGPVAAMRSISETPRDEPDSSSAYSGRHLKLSGLSTTWNVPGE